MPNTRQASPATLFPKEGSWLSLWESTKGTSFASLSAQLTERAPTRHRGFEPWARTAPAEDNGLNRGCPGFEISNKVTNKKDTPEGVSFFIW